MPATEVLILAVTKMLSGVCTAGMTREADPLSVLRWVRPVRPFDTLLTGDVTCADDSLFCCCDVVSLDLIVLGLVTSEMSTIAKPPCHMGT